LQEKDHMQILIEKTHMSNENNRRCKKSSFDRVLNMTYARIKA